MDFQSLPPTAVARIGVFLPNWVGDAVMATPTLRALRHHFSHARITGLMRPVIADVLAGTELVDEVVLYHRRSRRREQRMWSVIRRMRAARFDLVISLPNSLPPAWMAWLARARERVGYVRRDPRGWLLTRRLQPVQKDGRPVPFPTLDYYQALAVAVGCSPESPRMTLATTVVDEAAADTVWSDLGLGGRPVVTLNASGAFGTAKLWPGEHCANLARKIANELHADVLVLCGPAERTRARDIARAAGHPRVVSLAGFEPSIGLSKACVRRSRLLVTTDSGPRHFAAAFGVPAVVLFGPTFIAWSDTHAPTERHLQLDVDCGPCQQPECPLQHHKCMRNLSVEQVFAAVRRQFAGDAGSAAGLGL